MKPINVGLLGLGTVGCGTWTVLRRNEEEIARRAGRPIRITWIAEQALDRARELTRGAAGVNLTDDAAVVLAHPDIDIVVELIGGIEPARTFILQAIANGKHVVTANKALLAQHGNEIFAAAHAKGVMVAFEAAVAGGIPIIKALREGLTANRIEWIAGIINGTSNFILSEMRATRRVVRRRAEGGAGARLRRSRSDVRHRRHRRRAQAHDHVGDRVRRADAVRQGVHRRHLEAHARGHPLRRGAGLPDQAARHHAARRQAGIELRVHPTLIPAKRLIANVEGVMNAVLVKGDAVGATLYYGAGAGAEPTASAVIADLVDVTRMHTADPEHRVPHLAFQPDQLSDTPFLPMGEVATSYYLRMRVQDRPGVLADITRILADRDISIDAMIQKEPSEGEDQTDIILLTHLTIEKQRRRRDRGDRGAAHRRAARSCASAWKSSTDALRLDARRVGATIRSRSRAILLEGLAPDGGLAVPQAYPRCRAARARGAARRSATATSRSRCCRASSPTFPRADLKALIDRTYTAAIVRQRRDHAGRDARARPAPAARVERADARVQGHRAAAARQPVRVRARRSDGARAQHPRRDVGRHRQLGRVRDARQARRCACSCCRRTAG